MKVLITGATGFIGTSISDFLLDKGLEINYLTTTKSKIESTVNYKGFYWNPEKNEIDSKCIEGVDYIVNLSGKSIGCRWNSKNKSEILKSRIDSSKTLFKLLETNNHNVKKIISASAIGIYKNDIRKLQSETETNYNTDFLGTVCKQWEAENEKFNDLGIETLIVRFGLVLSDKNGALPKFAKAVKNYMASPFGTGNQWYSWIHIHDLVRVIDFGLKTETAGVLNAVTPYPKTQKDFLATLSRTLDKKMIMPAIPTGVLKVFFGEMHHLLTDSQKISSNKLLNLGFEFKYPLLKDALRNFYK
ncbi:TIGR01777 family oxidoreductase [Flavobacterium sp. I3-2]|uniref:TIGR01777 family oxidoreductase n=1 Tax=Flavobacterium sp. I3-2 TaxID=2748319 RepID=UPI0015AC1403|nr:TIGR01777 family oxidoreductase [Flavobacterium sp. I3-2]